MPFFLLILLLFSFESSASLPEKITKFDHYANKSFKDWKIPGMAIAIVSKNKIHYLKTFGVNDLETKQKINKDSVFRICSLSKTFTSELAGILVEQNILHWDQKLADILRDFKLSSYQASREVSIEHILSHSSGINSRVFDDLIEKKMSFELLRDKLSLQKIDCNPGKCYAYQNYIFSLIGEIFERVTGKSYAYLLENEIFKKLGMHNSSSGKLGFMNAKNRALPHYYDVNQYKVSSKDIITTYYSVTPSAGINSSIADMAIWGRAQLGAFPEVISPNILAKVYTPIIPTPPLPSFENNWPSLRIKDRAYGLGWRVLNYENEKLLFHGGMLNGYSNSMGFLPEHDIGIIILANSNTPISGFLMARFFDEFLNLPLKDYCTLNLKEYIRW